MKHLIIAPSQTNDGGPDGSILFEVEDPQNAGLKPALARLIKIKQEVQSTNEVRLSELHVFIVSALSCVVLA
jgi:hypothetical protein